MQELSLNFPTVVILLVILALAVLAIRRMTRRGLCDCGDHCGDGENVRQGAGQGRQADARIVFQQHRMAQQKQRNKHRAAVQEEKEQRGHGLGAPTAGATGDEPFEDGRERARDGAVRMVSVGHPFRPDRAHKK